MRSALKTSLLASGLYGPLKRARRRLFNHQEMQDFRDSVALYSALISPGDLCFDVGSNVGDKAEIFLKLGARVVAFEPQPDCAREILARCGHKKQLTVVEAAVGSTSGSAQMYVGKWNKVSSMLPNWLRNDDLKETIEVPVTTLDAAIAKYGLPRFCKIDVEGFEMEVLRGLKYPISTLTLEYHLTKAGIQKTTDCLEYLSRFGQLSINITRREQNKFYWTDWVMQSDFRNLFPIKPERPGDFGDLFIRIIS